MGLLGQGIGDLDLCLTIVGTISTYTRETPFLLCRVMNLGQLFRTLASPSRLKEDIPELLEADVLVTINVGLLHHFRDLVISEDQADAETEVR